jgi:hypothetical protein
MARPPGALWQESHRRPRWQVSGFVSEGERLGDRRPMLNLASHPHQRPPELTELIDHRLRARWTALHYWSPLEK